MAEGKFLKRHSLGPFQCSVMFHVVVGLGDKYSLRMWKFRDFSDCTTPEVH